MQWWCACVVVCECVQCLTELSMLHCFKSGYIWQCDNGNRDLEPMDVPPMGNSATLFAQMFNHQANDMLSVVGHGSRRR